LGLDKIIGFFGVTGVYFLIVVAEGYLLLANINFIF
jgi:hypothetical protein